MNGPGVCSPAYGTRPRTDLGPGDPPGVLDCIELNEREAAAAAGRLHSMSVARRGKILVFDPTDGIAFPFHR